MNSHMEYPVNIFNDVIFCSRILSISKKFKVQNTTIKAVNGEYIIF